MSISDALVSAGRLARTSGALALDRVWPARQEGIPFSLSRISAEWLTSALAPLAPGVRVSGFEILRAHSGTTTRARLGLEYASRGAGEDLPGTLFVKIAPGSAPQRLFLIVTGIGSNEVRFYRQIRPVLPVRAPAALAACSGPGGRSFVILLEDLVAAGARFMRVGDRATLEQAHRVVDALARMHAAFWESPRFGEDLAWLRCRENRRHDMAWERFVTGQMIGRAVRRFAEDFPPELRRIAELCIHRRDGLELLWDRGPHTLVHGDCHVGNLFFEEDRVGFLDWQVCGRGPGMRDVSYFLCNSLPTRLRREHERDLIQRYLDGLAAGGIAAPGFEAAWAQHACFAVYTWLAAAFTAAAGAGLQPLEVGLAGLRRSTTAAGDLGSVERIERALSS